MPIPAKHVETIFEVCRFPEKERLAFLDAYSRAHPGRIEHHNSAKDQRLRPGMSVLVTGGAVTHFVYNGTNITVTVALAVWSSERWLSESAPLDDRNRAAAAGR